MEHIIFTVTRMTTANSPQRLYRTGELSHPPRRQWRKSRIKFNFFGLNSKKEVTIYIYECVQSWLREAQLLLWIKPRLTFHPSRQSSRTGWSRGLSFPCCRPHRWLRWRGPHRRLRIPWRGYCPDSAGSSRTRHSCPGWGRGVRCEVAMRAWRWWAAPGSGCSDFPDSETGA